MRPRLEKVAGSLHSVSISPSGGRAAFEARGEIFTVPAEKGDVRNITRSPGVADRDPAWSPDGKWIAYFSDESGEYQFHVRDQGGLGEVKKYPLNRSILFRGKSVTRELPEWFKEMDTNKDGQVALSEWHKAGKDIEEFRTWDRNDDGFI